MVKKGQILKKTMQTTENRLIRNELWCIVINPFFSITNLQNDFKIFILISIYLSKYPIFTILRQICNSHKNYIFYNTWIFQKIYF